MISFKEFASIYPNFRNCSIQWFNDSKQGSDNTQTSDVLLAGHKSVSEVDWKAMKEKNDSGCGLFFSVNPMIKGMRSKDAVTSISAWVAESDKLSKEDQMKLIKESPLKPSMIIESKKSYHIYFFAKDGTKENWERIELGLADYFHGDKSFAKNYGLVLRLPLANHMKDPSNPFKCNIIQLEELYYTEGELLANFPHEPIQKVEKEHKPLSLAESSDIRQFMASLGNEYMLSRMSGSSIVNGEKISFKPHSGVKQIVCNDKITGCWIDKSDYIGSGSGDGGPTWIQWSHWYGVSKSNILKWFFEFCSDIIPEKFDRTSKIIAIEDAVKEDQQTQIEKDFNLSFRHITANEKMMKGLQELINTDPAEIMKFGWEEFDNYLGGIYGGKIYLIGAETGSGKTTFINQIAGNLSRAGVRVTRYSLEDRMEDSAKEDIYYMVNRMRYEEKRKPINWIHFVNGEYTHINGKHYDPSVIGDLSIAIDILSQSTINDLDKTRDVKIDELAALMESEADKGTRVFFIDHLHYFEFEADKVRMDLQIENAMKKINEVARKRNVAVFLVAHYSASGVNSKPGLNSFKGSSGIKQIANVVIQIERDDDGSTHFKTTKLRGPIQKRDIIGYFSLGTAEFSFTKTQEQKQKEKSFFEKSLEK